jgi:hypothetical protein
MTVYVAGSEVEIFDSFSGTVTTDSSVAISGINRAGVQFAVTGQNGIINFAAQTEAWVHFRYNRVTNGAAGLDTVFAIRNAANQNVFRINTNRATATDSRVQILSQSEVSLAAGNTFEIDVHFKIDEDGFVNVYSNQVLVASFTGDTRLPSGDQNASRLTMNSPGTTSVFPTVRFSQILVSSLPTLGARVHTLPLTAGSVNEWIGSVSDINDSSNTPSSLISTNTDEAEILMAAGDISSINTGNAITALVMSTASRALGGAAVTQQIGRVKLGATTYNMGSAVALSDGFGKVQHILALNPDTTAAWEASEINGAEIGFQALA